MVVRYDLHPPTDFADPEVALLFGALQDGTREWKEELALDGEPSPADLQRPLFASGHSIGALLLHIADVEIEWVETRTFGIPREFIEEKFMGGLDTDMENSIWPEPPHLTLAEHFKILQGARARTRRLLSEVEADRLFEHRGDEYTVRWLLNHLIGHEAYHAGQILLIRQAVDRIYGPISWPIKR
ncbi:DUF664 domain-containing protein [bacterium]|nr:MAG: DUF664 domain-containing protein [bacterium]